MSGASTALVALQSSVSVYAFPSSASGSSPGGGSKTTNSVGCFTLSGQTPFTYSWAHQSGDTGITANTSTSSSTTFTGTVSPASSKYAVWRCTVTDVNAQQGYVDVSVFLSDNSY